MKIKIIGGKWLKDRNNYDVEMCFVNGWECIQGRHYDALINNKKVEVKKTKSSSVIIKLQQLAEIILEPELSDIFYLIIKTDKMQDRIIDTIQIKALDICKHVGMTREMAEKVLDIHQTFRCTLQSSISLKDIKNKYVSEVSN
jgi:hypothetical protein